MGQDPKKIFEVETPAEIKFSLEDLFSELKNELIEERRKNPNNEPQPPAIDEPIIIPEHLEVDVNIDFGFGEVLSQLVEAKEVKKKPAAKKKVKAPKPKATVEPTPAKVLETPKNKDPIAVENTPTYMTHEEFQKHYRTFLSRIQTQIGSIGGGGAVNIRDMEDVEQAFITDPESLDGALMRMEYDPVQKVLKFFGDTSGDFTNPEEIVLGGIDGETVVVSNNTEFTIGLSPTLVAPGTMVVTGITTLSEDGSDTTTGGDIIISGKAKADTFSVTSDRRLKSNIVSIDDPISKLNQLNGVTFDWIKDGSSDVGLIAQDVEACLPQAVREVNDIKTVNYNGVVGLLVEAVKQLSKELEEVKKAK